MVRLVDMINEWYQVLLLLIGVLAVIPKTWKILFQVVKTVWELFQIIYVIPYRLSTILKLLDEKTVEKIISGTNQLQPNGGSSLVDRVTAITNQLKVVEESIKGTLAALGHAFFEADSNGSFTMVSKKLSEHMNMQVSESLGSGWSAAIHPDDRDKVEHEWEQAVKQQRLFMKTLRFLHDDGCIIHVQIQAFPVFTESKVLVKYNGVVHFVREEKPKPKQPTNP
jgi:PAS domain S-box-containing protein